MGSEAQPSDLNIRDVRGQRSVAMLRHSETQQYYVLLQNVKMICNACQTRLQWRMKIELFTLCYILSPRIGERDNIT